MTSSKRGMPPEGRDRDIAGKSSAGEAQHDGQSGGFSTGFEIGPAATEEDESVSQSVPWLGGVPWVGPTVAHGPPVTTVSQGLCDTGRHVAGSGCVMGGRVCGYSRGHLRVVAGTRGGRPPRGPKRMSSADREGEAPSSGCGRSTVVSRWGPWAEEDSGGWPPEGKGGDVFCRELACVRE